MSQAPSRPASACAEIRIELAGCTDKAELLARFARALHFPHWFGHNWDALSDCLTDLSWLPAPHYRLVLCEPQALRAAAPETLDTALEILAEAAEFWAHSGVAFEFGLSEAPAADRPPGPGAPAAPR